MSYGSSYSYPSYYGSSYYPSYYSRYVYPRYYRSYYYPSYSSSYSSCYPYCDEEDESTYEPYEQPEPACTTCEAAGIADDEYAD